MTKCRVCCNEKVSDQLIAKEMFLGTRDQFEYMHCRNCNSLSIVDVPENLDQYYNDYYSLNEKKQSDSIVRKFAKRLATRTSSNNVAKLCSKFLSLQDDLRILAMSPYAIPLNSKILDVGCGFGSFLQDLDALGYQNLVGIDPYLQSDSTLSANIMLKKCEFSDVKSKYDLITFHHAFEHTTKPKEILNHLRSILNKKGLAILRFPNIDSYSFKRFYENWEGIHAPFHMFLPSNLGMDKLTRDNGLRIVERRGEQMLSLFLNSLAHELNVCDYEKLGPRKFYENPRHKKCIPPLFTKKEIQSWKERTKQVVKYSLTDWIVYYIRVN